MRTTCALLMFALLIAGGARRSDGQPPEMRDFLASRTLLGTIYLQEEQVLLGKADKASLTTLAENLSNLAGSSTMVRIEGYAGAQRRNRTEIALLRAKEVADRLREASSKLPELTLTGFDARTIPGLAGREKDRVDIVIYDTVLNIHDADVETVISR